MTNRLAEEKSPYLRQHAENPVDWYPWGDEALTRARAENRPILLSVGYSACHWCHVMAHESFENPAIARLMNDEFINIKVDREERPDVDSVYMRAVQALTGQGGWPLNVFLTPDGRPFFGGTYFPPAPRYGMPSWQQVLESVSHTYRDQPRDVLHNARVLTEHIRASHDMPGQEARLSSDTLDAARRALIQEYDSEYGGFGGAPKFPQPLTLDLGLQLAVRLDDPALLEAVLSTLRHMARGGIHDQIGGGFHRYSVDRIWLVPHFEKMLYDNALLARVYLHAFQLTGDSEMRRVAESTLEYLRRDLMSPAGAFYSAEDADSEGIEGKFYVWQREDFLKVLGEPLGELAAMRFGVRPQGNWEGSTILTAAREAADLARGRGEPVDAVEQQLEVARGRLLAARAGRVRPGRDDKLIAGWNGLAMRTFAEAGRILRNAAYAETAERVAGFVLNELCVDTQLRRSWLDGPAEIPAFLEDYAFVVEGLLAVYETGGGLEYFQAAESMAAQMLELFGADGVMYDAPAGSELVVRPRNLQDEPIPSGNSAAASALLRLAALTGDRAMEDQALRILAAPGALLDRAPLAFSYALSALDAYLAGPVQVAVVAGDRRDADSLVDAAYSLYLPNRVVAIGRGDNPALLRGRDMLDGRPTAYVCRAFACRLPVTSADALLEQLRAARRPHFDS